MNRHEFDKMNTLESRHWWYRNLQLLTLDALYRFGVSRTEQIVDAACGTGGNLEFLKQHDFRKISGFDASDYAISHCREKFLDVWPGNLKNIQYYISPESVNVIICHDALYFLSELEQAQFMNAVYETLQPGGILLMNLPALPAYAGTHDKHVGIEKRFTRKDTKRLEESSGMLLIKQTFWPFLLSPLIGSVRFWQRMKAKKYSSENSDLKPVHPILNQVLFQLTRAENHLPLNAFTGSSLFTIFYKPIHDH